jgi:inosose dehydratase
MLETVRLLGYSGIELGPPGYFGDDPESVATTLEPFGVELAGAFTPLRIADDEGFRVDLEFLDRTLDVITATGTRGPVVLAADENATRLAAAGRPEATHATRLRGDDFRRAAERVELAAQRALDRGVTPAFHPHTATYIESAEEVADLLEATDPRLVKLALDTGHTVVGGGDPVELARGARDRVAHLHLKDVDPDVLARVRSQKLSVEDAWANGLFCALGDGTVDVAGVLAALGDFRGWVVLEQDRVAVRLDDLDHVRDVEMRNLAALPAK